MSRFLPKAFDGFTILQLSDLHVEMSEAAMMRLAAMLPDIDYDICVLTGVLQSANVRLLRAHTCGNSSNLFSTQKADLRRIR
jgi:predicted MPP superfamily phosphohydrolase